MVAQGPARLPSPPTLKTAIRKFNKKSASRACVPSKLRLQCYRACNATEHAIALSVTATEHGRQLISAVDWTLLLLCKMCVCGFANYASVALQIVQHTHTHTNTTTVLALRGSPCLDSESFSIAADVLPALEPQPAATRRCSTQADFVQTHDVRSWGCRDATEHSALGNPTETQGSSSGSNEPRTAIKTICVNDLSRDATEHSPMEDAYSRWVALQISMATDERWQENTTEPQASSAACIETCTAVQSDCVGDQPRDATEHSPWEKALPAHAGNTFFVPQDAHEHALVLMPASSTASPQATGPLLQCVDCEHPLCGTEDLAFFWRLAMLQSMHRFMSCG